MKTLLLLFSLSIIIHTKAQIITSETWYLNQVEIDGEIFPLPDHTILGYQADFYENYSDTDICNSITLNYTELTENSFYLTEFTSTLIECPDQPGLDEFEGKFASLFWFQDNQTFTYEILTDSEWNHIHTLIVTNPDGNKAYYGNDALNSLEHNDPQIQIYPNPFTEKITIENLDLNFTKIQLVDANGKLIKSKKINTSQVEWNLNHLPKGIYFIQFFSNSKILKTQKVIKK